MEELHLCVYLKAYAFVQIGHLARAGGTLTADIVEYEVQRALEWLEGDQQRRHAAVLVLRELAENTPTLFNVYVGSFLDHIWVALRDPKESIREGAIQALRACLTLIAKRDHRWRAQWYEKLFGEVQQVSAAVRFCVATFVLDCHLSACFSCRGFKRTPPSPFMVLL